MKIIDNSLGRERELQTVPTHLKLRIDQRVHRKCLRSQTSLLEQEQPRRTQHRIPLLHPGFMGYLDPALKNYPFLAVQLPLIKKVEVVHFVILILLNLHLQ